MTLYNERKVPSCIFSMSRWRDRLYRWKRLKNTKNTTNLPKHTAHQYETSKKQKSDFSRILIHVFSHSICNNVQTTTHLHVTHILKLIHNARCSGSVGDKTTVECCVQLINLWLAAIFSIFDSVIANRQILAAYVAWIHWIHRCQHLNCWHEY